LQSGTTRATIAIEWPVRTETRLIPVASNSIKVTITNGAAFTTTQIIARPAASATFENLPPGALTITAEAFSDAAASVTPAQASGVQTVTAVADEPFAINLTMNSTIDRLTLTQSAQQVAVGQIGGFDVTAQDAAGNLVLTGPSTWQWASSEPSTASLVTNGASATATALTAGATTVTVTETESGKTATLPLVVFPAPIITTESGLQYQDLVIGTGRSPVLGKRVAVYYVGTFKDGTVFDSRQRPAAPFIFTIGVGQVIRGWDEGVAGMREGGKRKLFVPAELAYGETGQGPIPPNTPIDFEVELLEIEP
jgi:peptidylprolyl isomerase